ncbi:preprotein translocase subunit YajC [Streptococcus dentapri]|uniref:Preprotein translocase subunit YajC n=1 Tax=Streptococcus dentapri TaxID=573564 RepID=A0ABV8D3F1_9STRE
MNSRAQKKQAAARTKRMNSLVKGAEVETIGGLIAIVDEVDHDNNRITLDADGVYLTFDLERSILNILSSPASETKAVDSLTTEETEPAQDKAEEAESSESAIEE